MSDDNPMLDALDEMATELADITDLVACQMQRLERVHDRLATMHRLHSYAGSTTTVTRFGAHPGVRVVQAPGGTTRSLRDALRTEGLQSGIEAVGYR